MIKTLYPCFRHWSEKGSVYLISDTHFDNVDREFMGYNFSEAVQIDRLKARCHKNDTLIHLGDVGNPEYMRQLKCHKVLLLGNHDETPTKFEPYFDEIYTGPLWIAEKLVISHEPIDIRFGDCPICLNIHGHDHSNTFYKDGNHINIAQNIVGYLPINLKHIIEDGCLKPIKTAHRLTIDKAVAYKGIRL